MANDCKLLLGDDSWASWLPFKNIPTDHSRVSRWSVTGPAGPWMDGHPKCHGGMAAFLRADGG